MVVLSIKSQGIGEIKGVVMDKETNQTLIGAKVWINYGSEKISTATDTNGKYTLKPIPTGTYSLHLSFTGKTEYIMEGVVVQNDKVRFIDSVYLADTSYLIGGKVGFVVVGFPDKLIDPEGPSKFELEAKKITKISGARNPSTLLSIASGGAISSSADGNEIYFRGSRSGTMVTFLDGIKILDNVPNIPQASIKTYRVYTGGIPAKYGDTMGGVVEIETKNFFDLYNQRVAERGIEYTNGD